jgi:hypothetical protein
MERLALMRRMQRLREMSQSHNTVPVMSHILVQDLRLGGRLSIRYFLLFPSSRTTV